MPIIDDNIESGDAFWMQVALDLASMAAENEDVPVGCVIVKDEAIIGKGYNCVEKDKDATAHAELIAIKEAIKTAGYKHLLDTKIYTTLEPCSMCAGAIVLARISEIIIAADDLKAGACGSVLNIAQNERLNHRCVIRRGVLREESELMIKDFFKKLREK